MIWPPGGQASAFEGLARKGPRRAPGAEFANSATTPLAQQACAPARDVSRRPTEIAARRRSPTRPIGRVWLDEEVAFVDRETAERVDEDAIDFATEDDPKRDAEEGLRHFSTVMEKTVFTPEWFCIDHQGAGLELHAFLKNTCPIVHGEGETGGDDSGDEAAARARREAEEAEAAKRERRKVLALNKLGDAAASVRREFVRKGAAIFVAGCVAPGLPT